jgi:hypothetical protein
VKMCWLVNTLDDPTNSRFWAELRTCRKANGAKSAQHHNAGVWAQKNSAILCVLAEHPELSLREMRVIWN